MNALIVFSPVTVSTDGPIVVMSSPVPLQAGTHKLAPGLYRFKPNTKVNIVQGATANAFIKEVPNDKKHWPDPPLLTKVVSTLHIPKEDIQAFFNGQNVAVVLD